MEISRTGVLTPVGIVAPVELSGAIVTRITLHHWGMVKSKRSNDWRRSGCDAPRRRNSPLGTCCDTRSGNDFSPCCPSCGMTTIEDGDLIRCDNRSSCPAQAVGVLSHYAKAIGIEGFGEVWLETFVDAGLLRASADFYLLESDSLLEFERMGQTLANKLLDEVERARRVPLEIFLYALGLPDVGKSVAETVASAFGSLPQVREAGESEFSALSGIVQSSLVI